MVEDIEYEEEELPRCSCGCFLAYTEWTNEGSGEEIEYWCNNPKCKNKWVKRPQKKLSCN